MVYFLGIKGYETDKELKPFVNHFVPNPDKYVYRLVDMNMMNRPRKFARDVILTNTNGNYYAFDGDVVGLALWGSGTVFIDKKFWNKAHALNRISVLWHEYGHHKLGPFLEWSSDFSHKNKKMSDGCPESVMYYMTIEPNCLYRHWNKYKGEVHTW